MIRTLDVRVDAIRNGVKVTELCPISAPSISMDSTSAIKSSMSATFLPNDDVDWLFDELMPIAIINGEENKLGIFSPATISEVREEGIKSISVEAYDRCWKAQSTKTESILHLNAGSNYITTIESLLLTSGISLVIKTPTSETLTYDREDWEIGTDYLTIINQLLSEINYNELWFNNEGYAILEPIGIQNINYAKRTYDHNSIESMMLANSTVELDLFNTPNVFLCVCSNIDGDNPLTATATNDNAASPFSVVRRGRRIMSMTKVDNIASQTALNDYAQILCTKTMFKGQKVSIATAIRTDCGVNDVVALVHPDAEGICIETSWQMELCAGGTMTHELSVRPKARM